MNVLEFVGPVSVSLDSSGITLKSAEKEVSLPLPVNLVSFYVAGGYAYWDLPVKDGEKPPRAVFYYKDSRLVLFTGEKGRAILLYERGEEKLSRVFRREELRTLLEWIRNSLKASMVEELANAYIRALMRRVQKWGSACMSEPYVKKKPENAKACEMFLSNVGRVARDTFDVSVKYQKELAEAIQTANVAYNLYSRLLAQMSNNNLYGNLMYSKMLGVVR